MHGEGGLLQRKVRPHFWVLQGSVSCDSSVVFCALHCDISTGRPSALSMHVMERCRVPLPHGTEHSPAGPSCRLYLSGPSTCTITQNWSINKAACHGSGSCFGDPVIVICMKPCTESGVLCCDARLFCCR